MLLRPFLHELMYDGEERRVSKTQGTQTSIYIYDAFGNLAVEYSGATSSCGTPTCFMTHDLLGSVRMLTDSTSSGARRYDYLPFGEELLAGTNGRTTAQGYLLAADGTEPKFTGQYRDYESGLDYFGARYYSGAMGRWTSADWSATPQPIDDAQINSSHSDATGAAAHDVLHFAGMEDKYVGGALD